MQKICIFLLVLFSGFLLEAQVIEEPKDTIRTGFSTGKIQIKDPKSVLSAYTYDPVTDKYIYTSSVDGFSINYPIILSVREYEQLVLKESMRDYFRKKNGCN